jgi:hypothetical protein
MAMKHKERILRTIDNQEIDSWGKAGGPLPSYPPGNVLSNRFWTAYQQGEAMIAMAGERGSLASRGFAAGLKRRKVEPGIDPTNLSE